MKLIERIKSILRWEKRILVLPANPVILPINEENVIEIAAELNKIGFVVITYDYWKELVNNKSKRGHDGQILAS